MIEQVLRMINLKQKSDLHIARKVWHMLGVCVIAGLYAYLPESTSLFWLTLVTVIAISMDVIRLKNPSFNDLVMSAMGPIMRKSEVDRLAGTTYLFSGVTLIAYIFPPNIVLLTLLFLAFADPMASYFGIRFGKDKIFGHKSLQGTIAAFVVCAVITYIFLTAYWLMIDRVFIVSLFAGLIGALAELIPIGKLDDNFTLPVMSAVALWMLFHLFGAFSGVAPLS